VDDDGMKLGWFLVVIQFVLLIALVLVPRRAAEPLSFIIGSAVILAGVFLGAVAFRALGNALTPTPVPIAGAGLRRTGIYSYMRHPIYSAVLLMVFGYVIAMGSWWSVLVAGILVLFFTIKLRWEDQLLHQEYGPEWEAWAHQTNSLIPKFRR
jgi:protein-S-isoprenylcysteine O-methyltransferase Ste14